ncbi:MAG: hypothetical protein ACKO24_04320 [Leptolyngbyaceae cyanobacterium]
MTTPYTVEESAKVIRAVMISGLAVAVADMGIVSTAIEAAALTKEVMGAAQKYPDNSVIQSIFSNESIQQNTPTSPPEGLTPDNAAEIAVSAINDAIAVINQRATPEEVSQFKQLVYACSETVANAAGEGLFGSGAVKVSAKEAATLAKIKAALVA